MGMIEAEVLDFLDFLDFLESDLPETEYQEEIE